MPDAQDQPTKGSRFERMIRGITRVGNRLPHPFTLFMIMAVLALLLSWTLSLADVSVTYQTASRAGEASVSKTVEVQNLLSADFLSRFITELVKIYIGFAPLGIVLVMMLGIGLVEQSGLISALMRKTVLGAPPYLVTATLALVGINANLASDAAVIFTPAIGAALFKALGRNPWVGIIAGFAAASGGFTANFFVAGTDALLAGITTSASQGMGINAPTHPLINWYFMLAATAVVTLVTTVITERFTTRMLGDGPADGEAADRSALEEHAVTPAELRGLRFAGVAALIFISLLLVATVPEWALLRNADGNLLPKSPLTNGIVAILCAFFMLEGIAYGIGAGTISSEGDIPKLMETGMRGALSFMVVALPAAIFIHFINQSQLTTILAVKGGLLLKELQLGSVTLVIMFIVIVTFLNLFMVSGSAKWLILAPIFVPMFAMAGLSPALTQLAYRVGDSATNIVSPLSYYIPVIIGLLEQYRRKDQKSPGLGTVIALEIPYAIGFLLSLGALLAVWILLDLPLGPGAGVYMP